MDNAMLKHAVEEQRRIIARQRSRADDDLISDLAEDRAEMEDVANAGALWNLPLARVEVRKVMGRPVIHGMLHLLQANKRYTDVLEFQAKYFRGLQTAACKEWCVARVKMEVIRSIPSADKHHLVHPRSLRTYREIKYQNARRDVEDAAMQEE